MRKRITGLTILLFACLKLNAQSHKEFTILQEIIPEAEYDRSTAWKTCPVFCGQEAQMKLKELCEEDPELKSMYFYEVFDEEGNSLGFDTEVEIIEYFPTIGVIVSTGGHGFISAFDLNRKEGTPYPAYCVYSPSGKYRLSINIDNSETYYYLEEIAGWYYERLVDIGSNGLASGFYWLNDETFIFKGEFCTEPNNPNCQGEIYSNTIIRPDSVAGREKHRRVIESEPKTITFMDGKIRLQIRGGGNFPCIGLQFMGMGTCLEFKKIGDFYVTDFNYEKKTYNTITDLVEEYLEDLIKGYYHYRDKPEYGNAVWEAFLEEDGLQQFLEIIEEFIDDEFLLTPFNEVYG